METDMVLFMEKLPPEFIAGAGDNLSITDFQFSPPPTLRTPIIHFNNPPGMREMEMTSSASMAGMREMIFRIAAMQPVDIDPETVKPPKRRNVKISRDPQSVAARHRRERISQRIRILQRLVPGGTKMDTASMLDEAIHYVKFLKFQVQSLETAAAHNPHPESAPGVGFPMLAGGGSCFPAIKGFPSNTHHAGTGTGGFEHQYNNSDSWMLN